MQRTMVMVMTVLLVLSAFAVSSAKKVELGTIPDYTNVVVEESNDQRTVVRLEVGAFDMESVNIQGDSYWNITCGDEPTFLNEAEPQLPHVCRAILIPDDAKMSVRVIGSEYTDYPNTQIAPSKGNLPRTVDPSTVPYRFGSAYSSNAWYPAEIATLRDPFIQRDYRGTVVELNAFTYNNAKRTLRVYSSITVEIVNDGPGSINVLQRNKSEIKMVSDFEVTYRRRFINYPMWNTSKYTSIPEVGDMLIIAADEYASEMQPFIDWKIQKGVNVTMLNVSEVGNTPTNIANTIQSFYDTTDLAFVLLVGDAGDVAKPSGSGNSDPIYAKVAGSDDYPDIFIGRFSADSPADVATQVERTVTYETSPVAGDWYHKGVGIGSNDAGTGQGGEHDWEHEDLIRDDLLAFTYTQVDQLYATVGATAADVANSLNDGRSILNYTGHGSSSGWGTTGFSNSNVSNLVNDNMLPFIVHVACNVGTFDYTTCFCEYWQRSTNSSTGAPTGAIANYGSYISQSWSPPMDCQDEVVDLLVAMEKTSFGGLCFNGASKMIDLNGGDGIGEYNAWTLFGDPSVQVRTDTPAPLTVSHDGVLLFTLPDYSVTVVGVEGALCALSADGVLYGSAFTDAGGVADINLDVSPMAGQVLTLTVTSFNAVTYTTDVQVIAPSGPYVVYSYHEIDDGTGNGDGLADIGETISLSVGLVNVGPDAAADVVADISTTDMYATINDGTEAYGTIQADFDTVYIADGFEFTVGNDAPDGHLIGFDLEVNGTARDTWTGSFSVPVHAPNVGFVSVGVDDGAYGDGNGILDPGETASLVVTVENLGSGAALAATGTLAEYDSHMDIVDGDGTFGDITAAGGVANNSTDVFEVSADAGTPLGYDVTIDLQITAGAYTVTVPFTVTIGDRVVIFSDDFSWDQGWTGLGGSGEWEMGVCQGLGDDPSSDHSPTGDNRVLGNDLSGTGEHSGEYEDDLSQTYWVYSPIIDCSVINGVIMYYWHWLGCESDTYDHAYFDVFDGTSWVRLYENGATLQESQWVLEDSLDLSAYADFNPTFQLRFGIGTTDGSQVHSGWNIDDIMIKGYGSVGTPDMVMAPETLADSVQPGGTCDVRVALKNEGDGTLAVSFTSEDTWLDFSKDVQILYPNDSIDFLVTVNAASLAVGDHSGALHYSSNDQTFASGNIPVELHVFCPDIAIMTESMSEHVTGGGQESMPLSIDNNGPGRLDYMVRCQMDAVRGAGGSDEFGYSWIDSDEESGPAYSWIEISSVGTEINLNDDNFAGPFPIGFSFPMYDSTYDEFYVSSNGYISFDAGSSVAVNQEIPASGVTGSMIAMFWDNLNPGYDGHVYYYFDATKGCLVVSFVDVPLYFGGIGTGTLYFQAQLYANGVIQLHYFGVNGGQLNLSGATIGIQNSAHDDGLQVSFNEPYVHDFFAVQIAAAHWLATEPAGGSVDPMASGVISVKLNAEDLEDGTYNGSVIVQSNDPDTPSWTIPVSMSVSSSCCVGVVGNIDCDPNQSIDGVDLSYLLDHLFINFEPLCCEAEADMDFSNSIDGADLSVLLDNLFINLTPMPSCR